MSDTSGRMYYAPFARWDRDSSSWRTSEATCLLDLTLSSLTLPVWGGLRSGELSELPTPEPAISGRGFSSLPTPTAQDASNTAGPSQMDRNSLPLNTLVTLLPTPVADNSRGLAQSGTDFQSLPNAVINLLPTPAVNDMGDGKTLEWWDEWAPRQQSSDGRPAPHGKSLAIEALRMLPTPTAQAAKHGETPDMTATSFGFNLWDLPHLLPSTGATTAPLSPDGLTSSDDPHQPRPSQDATDGPDCLPLS